MEVLKYCKEQICLLFILFFMSYLFIKEGNRLNRKTKITHCNHYFDTLFILGIVALVFDGVTAYTVNHLTEVPETINMIAHLLYLLSYQLFIFIHFRYWLAITDISLDRIHKKIACYLPIVISALTTTLFINKIEYNIGEYTNYSMGIPAYTCYISIVIYSIATLVILVSRKNYIQKNKITALVMTLTAVCVITLTQMIFKETLISGLAVVLVILSIYLCTENPSIKFLEFYHDEMIIGFATLVENKDGSTGTHIHRSSAYAVLIAEELRKEVKYNNLITKDFIMNLQKASPMHDIGKIGIPDSILQKPGKLTEEEFTIMKKHPEIGGRIIQETFGHLDDDEYEHMAYNVAKYHHEKWNGKGYPCGLKETDIPLVARIMAVADVFDAISSKRCYRDPIPLDKCYQIIRDGSGVDFDPEIVDAFFKCKKQIEKIFLKGK